MTDKKTSITFKNHIYERIARLNIGQSFNAKVQVFVKIALKQLNEKHQEPPIENIEDEFGLVMISPDNDQESFEEHWNSK